MKQNHSLEQRYYTVSQNKTQRQLAHSVMYMLRNMLNGTVTTGSGLDTNKRLLKTMYRDMLELNEKRIEAGTW